MHRADVLTVMTVDPTAPSSDTDMSARDALGYILLDWVTGWVAVLKELGPLLVLGGLTVFLWFHPSSYRMPDSVSAALKAVLPFVPVGLLVVGYVVGRHEGRRETLRRLADEIWRRREDEQDADEDEGDEYWWPTYGPSFAPGAPRLGDPLARWWPPTLDRAFRQHEARVRQVIEKRRIAGDRAARLDAAWAHPVVRRAHAIVRHARAALVQMLVALIGVGLLVAVAVWIVGLVRYFFTS